MIRSDVLVTAGWAEQNLDTDGVVFLEVDEDTTAYDGWHIPGAGQGQLDRRAAGPGPAADGGVPVCRECRPAQGE